MSELPPPVDTYNPGAADYAANLDEGLRSLRANIRDFQEGVSGEIKIGLEAFLAEKGLGDFDLEQLRRGNRHGHMLTVEPGADIEGLTAAFEEYQQIANARMQDANTDPSFLGMLESQGAYLGAALQLTEIEQYGEHTEDPETTDLYLPRRDGVHSMVISRVGLAASTILPVDPEGFGAESLREVDVDGRLGAESNVYVLTNPCQEVPAKAIFEGAVQTIEPVVDGNLAELLGDLIGEGAHTGTGGYQQSHPGLMQRARNIAGGLRDSLYAVVGANRTLERND